MMPIEINKEILEETLKTVCVVAGLKNASYKFCKDKPFIY